MIRPGKAPKYVLLCPRISASSRTPPRDIFTNLRSNARATLFAKDVLPTPGGPTKQMIGAFNELVICLTAKYSRIRSFTFSRP